MPTDGPARATRGPTPVNKPFTPADLHISVNVCRVVILIAFSVSFSICLLVFATSRGHVAPAARLPATKPAAKFAPNTLAALPSSPTRPSSFLRIYTWCKQCEMHAIQVWHKCLLVSKTQGTDTYGLKS